MIIYDFVGVLWNSVWKVSPIFSNFFFVFCFEKKQLKPNMILIHDMSNLDLLIVFVGGFSTNCKRKYNMFGRSINYKWHFTVNNTNKEVTVTATAKYRRHANIHTNLWFAHTHTFIFQHLHEFKLTDFRFQFHFWFVSFSSVFHIRINSIYRRMWQWLYMQFTILMRRHKPQIFYHHI